MDKPVITKDLVTDAYLSKYIKVYDIEFQKDSHYLVASRREKENLVATKTDAEFQKMLPDAVTIALVVILPDGEEKLLLNYEFRYPAGQFLLSPPAGLIDPEDAESKEPLLSAAKREILEETGIEVKEDDSLFVLYPLLFSTPGMTDESNAIVCARVKLTDTSKISQSGAVGSECFNGYKLVSRKEARELLANGTDPQGNYYSVFTCLVLQHFLSEEK